MSDNCSNVDFQMAVGMSNRAHQLDVKVYNLLIMEHQEGFTCYTVHIFV